MAMATGLQLAGQFFGAGLGTGEDDHRVERLDFQDAGQRVQLVHAAHPPVALADVGRGGGLGRDGHFHRVLQVGLRDAADLRRHGGREQRNLALFRQLLQHGLDVIDEAHAQHFVGFVQHQGLQLGQVQGAAVQVIDHAAGCTDHDVHAAAQRRQLLAVRLAAVHRQHAEARDLRRIRLERLGHLDGQLAGRRQDQGLGLDLLQVDVGQYRQCERSGLAGTGLGLAQHVAAFQHRRDGGGLDRRRGFVADGGDRLHHGLGQAELRKLQRRLGILGHGELRRHCRRSGSAIKKGWSALWAPFLSRALALLAFQARAVVPGAGAQYAPSFRPGHWPAPSSQEPRSMQILEFDLDGDYVELKQLLKLADLVTSGGEAKMVISEGQVLVDGEVELRKACKIRAGQVVEFADSQIRVLAAS
ncbi:hypothetical protein G6F31_013996 [Rhizopus arrhizus]|nr:hypothetical protein G6F31_013996 [Rhizopus arrhizus]